MSYRFQSNQSGDIGQLIVLVDIVKRGWIPSEPRSRDCTYDMVIDRGNNVFETLQVKNLQSHKFFTTNRGGSGSNPYEEDATVSLGGKARNRYFYKDFGIHWIAGVDKSTAEIFYYPLETYQNYEVIDVRSVPSTEFPQRNVDTHTKPTRLFSLNEPTLY